MRLIACFPALTPLRVIVAVLTAVAGTAAAAVPAPRPADHEFHFVVLGDAQFHDPPAFNRLVDQTRRLGPAFAIQVGDMIEGYLPDLEAARAEWDRFDAQIAPLAPVPWIPVPGNHDVYAADRQVDPALEALFESRYGPLHRAFEYGNAQFILLNSDSTALANGIDARQLDWLEDVVRGVRVPHRFVFMHRPPHFMKQWEGLHATFERLGVTHVFYGHQHHYHHFQRDGIDYFMTNAAADSAVAAAETGSFDHLLQVSVRDGRVDVAVIRADAVLDIDAVAARDNYDLFGLTRKLAPTAVALPAAEPPGTPVAVAIPLENPTDRTVNVHPSCDSADGRWRFEPTPVPAITLAPKSRATLALTVGYAPGRIPDSSPGCRLLVPFSTERHGWISHQHVIEFTTPGVESVHE